MENSKTMFRVEKFTPRACPHCKHEFNNQNTDWLAHMGTIVDGQKIPDPQWPRIICTACDGEPIKQKMLKAYVLSDEAEIDRLVETEGFANKQRVEAFGHMAKDHVVDYPDSDRQLEIIRCD